MREESHFAPCILMSLVSAGPRRELCRGETSMRGKDARELADGLRHLCRPNISEAQNESLSGSFTDI